MTEASVTNENVSAVIVGGGLSGLALSRDYARRNIDHVVLEASPLGKNQSIHYITSKQSANSLGLSKEYERELQIREPITGYKLYDGTEEGLVPLESLSPSRETRDGFVTLSIAQIRDHFTDEGLPIRRGQSVREVKSLDGENLSVATTKGDSYITKVVIDATGARAKIIQLAETANQQLIANRLVRYCYGGVFSYGGAEDELLFIDKFPAPKDSPQEGAGWIMPLGNNQAEVVVAWEGLLGNLPAWQKPELSQLLSSYIGWFQKRGIEIDQNGKTEVISGFYSEGLLDYRKLPIKPSVIAFGESIGLNYPTNGYLIRNIARYAEIMGEETEKYLATGKWNPYGRLIGESRVNYGLQQSHTHRKMAANMNGVGRFKATGKLKDLLVDSLGEDGFWEVIDNGAPLGKLLLGVIQHPQYLGEVATIGTLYLKELFRNNGLYLSELGLKLKNKLKK